MIPLASVMMEVFYKANWQAFNKNQLDNERYPSNQK